MHHFFIPSDLIQNDSALLPAETSRQILKVLRLKNGEKICLLDNSGMGFEAELECDSSGGIVRAHVLRSYPVESEPRCAITLFLALTQREKFEWILQKSTEAGVSAIVPVFTERSLVRPEKDFSARVPRWEKIMQEAAEQSGRGIIPRLHAPLDFSEALRIGANVDCSLFFWEEDTERTLRKTLEPLKPGMHSAALFIGPEGGFSATEAEQAALHGWQAVTLGKRIYRMETAALAAVILTLYELER